MGDSVESLAEVEVGNTHCSPFTYPASHAIIESYQIGQARFPLRESMLTTPDKLFSLHLLNDDIQNELFHHLSRDVGEADQPVTPSVFLLVVFEDWNDSLQNNHFDLILVIFYYVSSMSTRPASVSVSKKYVFHTCLYSRSISLRPNENLFMFLKVQQSGQAEHS